MCFNVHNRNYPNENAWPATNYSGHTLQTTTLVVSAVAAGLSGPVPCVCCVLQEGAGAGQGHSCGAQPRSKGDCV